LFLEKPLRRQAQVLRYDLVNGPVLRRIQERSSRLGSRGGAPIFNRLEGPTGWSLRQSRLQTGAPFS
ncbi:MAG: hypothetical protein AAB676_19030, partial [Verrucomicrobiota bacterium]